MRQNLISLAVLVLLAVASVSQTLPLRSANSSRPAAASAEAAEEQRLDYFWRSPDLIYIEQKRREREEERRQQELVGAMKDASPEEQLKILSQISKFVSDPYLSRRLTFDALYAGRNDLRVFKAVLDRAPMTIEYRSMHEFFSGQFHWERSVLLPAELLFALTEKVTIGSSDAAYVFRAIAARSDWSREDRLGMWSALLSRAQTPAARFIMEFTALKGEPLKQRDKILGYGGVFSSEEWAAAFAALPKRERRKQIGDNSIYLYFILADADMAKLLLDKISTIDENSGLSAIGIATEYPHLQRLILERIPDIRDPYTARYYADHILSEGDEALWRLFDEKTRGVRFDSISIYDYLLRDLSDWDLGKVVPPAVRQKARTFFLSRATEEAKFVFRLREERKNPDRLLGLVEKYSGTVEEAVNIIEALRSVRNDSRALKALDGKLGYVTYRSYPASLGDYIYAGDLCRTGTGRLNDDALTLFRDLVQEKWEDNGSWTHKPAQHRPELFQIWLRHMRFEKEVEIFENESMRLTTLPSIPLAGCLLWHAKENAAPLQVIPQILAMTDQNERILHWRFNLELRQMFPANPAIRQFLERQSSEEASLAEHFLSLKTIAERKAFLKVIVKKGQRFETNGDAFMPDWVSREMRREYTDPEFIRLLWPLLTQDQLSGLSRFLSYALNELHDQGALERQRSLAEALPPRSWYLMISQGQEVYTSTFELLYGLLREHLARQNLTLREFISSNDREEEFVSKFLLTMSYFDRLGDLMRTAEEADFWTKLFMKLLVPTDPYDSEYYAAENGLYLMPTLEKIFSGGDRKIRERFEAALLELYEKTPESKKTSTTRRTLEIIFWKLRDRFSPKAQRKVQPVLRHLDELYKRQHEIPYAEWTKKTDVLTVFLNWHPQETGHLANFIVLAKSRGYRVVSQKTVAARNTLGSKPETEIVLEKDINVSASPFRKVRFLNRLSSRPDIKKVMEDPTIQIVAHRGHSYQLMDTFYDGATTPFMKMLFIGSCGGFRSIPELAKKYGGKNLQFLASLAVTEGAVNNPLLLYVVEQIAAGKAAKWQDIKGNLPTFLKDQEKARAFVWPGELPMLLLFSQSN